MDETYVVESLTYLVVKRHVVASTYNQMSQFQNAHFYPISASCSNFNPRNIQYIPVVKIFAFLDLEQNWTFWNWLKLLSETVKGKRFALPCYLSPKRTRLRDVWNKRHKRGHSALSCWDLNTIINISSFKVLHDQFKTSLRSAYVLWRANSFHGELILQNQSGHCCACIAGSTCHGWGATIPFKSVK